MDNQSFFACPLSGNHNYINVMRAHVKANVCLIPVPFPIDKAISYLKKNVFRRFDDWRGLEEGTWRPRHLQRRGLGSREGDITSEDDLGFSSDAYTQQVANYLDLIFINEATQDIR